MMYDHKKQQELINDYGLGGVKTWSDNDDQIRVLRLDTYEVIKALPQQGGLGAWSIASRFTKKFGIASAIYYQNELAGMYIPSKLFNEKPKRESTQIKKSKLQQ